jgi:transcription termination/antitermination protein NusA
MKSEFSLAMNEIMERFGLAEQTVLDALEAAMVSAYRKSVNASNAQNVEAHFEFESGDVTVFAEKEVVDSVENPLTEVTLEVAKTFDPEAEMGALVRVDSTPDDFGRVAAQTAKQVILQRLREAEREAQYDEFAEREGDMVHGTVHSITPQAVTIGLGRAEAILPRNQQIPGEQFRIRDRVRVYVLEVRRSSRGPVIVVSRAHPHMLRRLLEMEVPEINQGLVEIKAIAREAGKRAKVAVAAIRDGIDPVGACVGLRGVRIQSIVRDLNDEKIDVIEWNPDSSGFIAKALSPARVSGVYLDEESDRGKTAMVVVPEDQLSLAIGRSGVNARLSARLTGWRIDIKSLPEAAIDSLNLAGNDPIFAEMAKDDAETITQMEAILLKKSENRPITPEEYKVMTAFVDKVQLRAYSERDAKRREIREMLAETRALIPESAYQTSLEESGLSGRVLTILTEAGYKTLSKVMETIKVDENAILGLSGFGPKALKTLKEHLDPLYQEKPVPEPVVEEETVEDADAQLAVGEEAELATGDAADAIAEAGAEAEAVVAAETEGEVAAEAVDGEVEPVDGVAQLEEPEAAEVAVLETIVDETVDGEAVLVAAEEDAEGEAEVSQGIELDKAFEAIAVSLTTEVAIDESIEEIDDDLDSKKKRKEKSRLIEFDPELGETIVKRRRKRGGGAEDWDEFNVDEY